MSCERTLRQRHVKKRVNIIRRSISFIRPGRYKTEHILMYKVRGASSTQCHSFIIWKSIRKTNKKKKRFLYFPIQKQFVYWNTQESYLVDILMAFLVPLI